MDHLDQLDEQMMGQSGKIMMVASEAKETKNVRPTCVEIEVTEVWLGYDTASTH